MIAINLVRAQCGIREMHRVHDLAKEQKHTIVKLQTICNIKVTA